VVIALPVGTAGSSLSTTPGGTAAFWRMFPRPAELS